MAMSHADRGGASPLEGLQAAPRRLSLAGLAVLLVRRRRLFVLCPVVAVVLVLAIGILLPRRYSAYASFTPQGGAGGLSSLAGLASQFGIGLPSGEAGQSPAFYASVARSKQLLRAVAQTTFDVPLPHDSTFHGTLIDAYGITGGTEAKRLEDAVEELEGHVSVTAALETGLVQVWVDARWAPLARQIAERILALVNEFNLESRQARADAQRRFIEARVLQARDETRQVEAEVEQFLRRNREFRNSPQLTLEYDRLQREVSLRQQVYLGLAQAFEQARIDAARNTPVITVVERPIDPAEPDSRRLGLLVGVGLLLGVIAAFLLAVGEDLVGLARQEHPEAFRELTEAWQGRGRSGPA